MTKSSVNGGLFSDASIGKYQTSLICFVLSQNDGAGAEAGGFLVALVTVG